MADIVFSPQAVARLDAIHGYIADELDSPRAAADAVDLIPDRVESLSRFPLSGPLLSSIHPAIPERFAQTRFLVCGKYIAVYDVSGDAVHILRVYHGSEDYVRYLFAPE